MSIPQITATDLSRLPAPTAPGSTPGSPGDAPGELPDAAGDRRDVLLVGTGLGTGVAATWAEAARPLSDRFRVVGWDLPGHGSSPAHADPVSVADLAAAVAALVRGPEAAVTVPDGARLFYAGVSISGAVALQLGLDHGDLFDGIAVVCSAASFGGPDAWTERARTVAASGTPTQVAGSAERWFGPGFVERHPERSTRLLHTLQDADRHSYARLCEALGGFDVRDRLAEISVPLLTIHGAHDVVCPPDRGEEITRAVRRGTSAVVESVAHQAPLEEPEETARLLTEHLGAEATGAAEVPIGHDRLATGQEVHEAGMAVRRQVLGTAHVDRAESRKDETTQDFQDLITRYAWGTIWTRPGLDRRMRSAVTITALVAGGFWDECAMHLRAALRNGLSREEIGEILLQTSIYCSVPAANTAFQLAQRVFAEVDEDLAGGKDL